MKTPRINYGRKGLYRQLGSYYNGFVKPGNKFYKKKAARRMRYNGDVPNGNFYKKMWGWWEWC
jgi:hypothetical protein